MNKIDGMIVLEVINSNPNGDPENAGSPRQRDNGLGEISSVSVKRKLRDLIEYKENNFIWEEVGADLDPNEFKIFESKATDLAAIQIQIKEDFEGFTNTYWDARLFGNTLLEKGKGDTVRAGALHFGVGMSISPVKILEETFTKKAPVEVGKKSGMAPSAFNIVEYGIYTIPLFYTPLQGIRTGCRDVDVELCFKLIPFMYEHTKSIIRTQVNILHAHIGLHGSKIGTFRSCDFLDSLTPTKKQGTLGDKRSDFVIPTWKDIKEQYPGVAKYSDVNCII